MHRNIMLPTPEYTRQIGAILGHLLQNGDVVCLSGTLGAGKTTLAAGIGVGWGATHPLTSPTFTLVREYHRPRDGHTLFHLDVYRLAGPDDVESIGLEDILAAEGSILIEWADTIRTALPPDQLWLVLEDGESLNQRWLSASATGPQAEARLADWFAHIDEGAKD